MPVIIIFSTFLSYFIDVIHVWAYVGIYIYIYILVRELTGVPMQPPWYSASNYIDVIMTTMVSQITSLTVVYSTVYSDADQRKHQSSASLAFVWGIHRGPVNSSHNGPVTRKMFPFDDVIMGTILFRGLSEIILAMLPEKKRDSLLISAFFQNGRLKIWDFQYLGNYFM